MKGQVAQVSRVTFVSAIERETVKDIAEKWHKRKRMRAAILCNAQNWRTHITANTSCRRLGISRFNKWGSGVGWPAAE